MNTVVVHFTKFGNTQKVAEAIAETLGAGGTARVLGMDQLRAAGLGEADLVVVGCPTHRMNLPEAVRPLLDGLPRGMLRGTAVAAFDTSYRTNALLSRFTAAKRLNRRLRKLGGKPAVPPETFYVTGREGPLEEGEIERAGRWAAAILAQVRGHPAPSPH